MQLRIIIVDVFYFLLPSFVFVNFIKKNVRTAMSVVIFNQVNDRVIGKPYVVKLGIQCFLLVWKGAQDVLKKHCCFSNSFGTLYDNQPIIPINLLVEIPGKTRFCLSKQATVSLKQSIHFSREILFWRKGTNLTLKKQIFRLFFTLES